MRIAITGPESSGKTTLAEALSHALQYTLIPEYARIYLTELGVEYQWQDVIHMAQTQHKKLMSMHPHQNLVADTESVVMKIWLEEKFGEAPAWIDYMIVAEHFDIYFLCAPDIPWERDVLRENREDRDRLFESYEQFLIQHNLRYMVLRGPHVNRLQEAKQLLEEAFK